MTEANPVRCFNSEDGDRRLLDGQTVAVVGYGNLGRSVSLNLRDSGCAVVVGNIGDEYRMMAAEDGFAAKEIPEAVACAQLVVVLLPDDVVPEVFADSIAPSLRAGSTVCFASGYVLAFGLVEPPPDIDVVMLAPRMLGEQVRQAYTEGFFSYVSVERDATGHAEPRLLALADAVGSLRQGAVGLSADEEALLDLFVEQTFGPYLGMALQTAFEVATEAGLSPEAVALELYMSGEMSRTVQAFADEGFFNAVAQHGNTAAYGGFTRLSGVDNEHMLGFFRETLTDIRGGGFAARLQQERAEGYPTLAAIRQFTGGPTPLTDAEQNLRKQFPALRARRDAQSP